LITQLLCPFEFNVMSGAADPTFWNLDTLVNMMRTFVYKFPRSMRSRRVNEELEGKSVSSPVELPTRITPQTGASANESGAAQGGAAALEGLDERENIIDRVNALSQSPVMNSRENLLESEKILSSLDKFPTGENPSSKNADGTEGSAKYSYVAEIGGLKRERKSPSSIVQVRGRARIDEDADEGAETGGKRHHRRTRKLKKR
jgi:hypothetical protein